MPALWSCTRYSFVPRSCSDGRSALYFAVSKNLGTAIKHLELRYPTGVGAHDIETAQLPRVYKDRYLYPEDSVFDRLLIAQARVEGQMAVSANEILILEGNREVLRNKNSELSRPSLSLA